MLLLTACSDRTVSDDTGPSESLEQGGDASTTTPMTAADPNGAVEALDVTPADPVDPETAASVTGLFQDAAIVAPTIDAGDWFSDVFSEPLAFRLPQSGVLIEQARGSLMIRIGPPDAPTGLIRLIEAVALSSANGPIPIGTIDAESEFADSTKLDEGLLTADDRTLSWRDLIIDSLFVPDNFESACSHSDFRCVDALITESGSVLTEMDTVQRFVGQDYADRRFYVIATPFDPADHEFLDLAVDVAASLVLTNRTADAGRRPLADVGLRADSIPGGLWFIPFADATVEIDLRSDLDGFEVLAFEPTWFAITRTPGDREEYFSVQQFQGFHEGADVAMPADGNPLLASRFFEGLAQIVDITARETTTIGDLNAERFEIAIPSAPSPFTCTVPELSDLDPDDPCVRWTIDGWRYSVPLEPDQRTDYLEYYIESAGLVVSVPAIDDEGQLVIDPDFAMLFDGLAVIIDG